MKSLDEFGQRIGKRKGGMAYCRSCHNVKKEESRTRVHGGSRPYHLKRRYGISEADYDALVARQGGSARCAANAPRSTWTTTT